MAWAGTSAASSGASSDSSPCSWRCGPRRTWVCRRAASCSSPPTWRSLTAASTASSASSSSSCSWSRPRRRSRTSRSRCPRSSSTGLWAPHWACSRRSCSRWSSYTSWGRRRIPSAAPSWTRLSRDCAMRCITRRSWSASSTRSTSRSSPCSSRCCPAIRRSTSVPDLSIPSTRTALSTEFFKRLRERAVQIHVEDHLRSRLERGDRLRVKLGLDPTAPDLHVGHLVVLDTLRMFQDEGHTVVVIIGDYTALIGDPSGRSETRPMLTEDQVEKNAETYFKQLDIVLDRKKIEVRRNSEWLGSMSAADILRHLAKATLPQVLQ